MPTLTHTDQDPYLIKCLDHGHARLLSYTQPVPCPRAETGKVKVPCSASVQEAEFGDTVNVQGFSVNEGSYRHDSRWTGDLEIVRNARISHQAAWRTGADAGKDEKLINYMATNKHTTPFEAMVFTFEVQAPIFVFRQWHRHRTWSYNEVSARYSELDLGFYLPDADVFGVQSTDNKQARVIDGVSDSDSDSDSNTGYDVQTVRNYMRVMYEEAFRVYKLLLSCDVPRELARCVLPVGAYSRMNATVDLHNLFHFLRLRLHSHAQYEIRVYAQALLQLIEPVVPIAVQTFKESLGHEYDYE